MRAHGMFVPEVTPTLMTKGIHIVFSCIDYQIHTIVPQPTSFATDGGTCNPFHTIPGYRDKQTVDELEESFPTILSEYQIHPIMPTSQQVTLRCLPLSSLILSVCLNNYFRIWYVLLYAQYICSYFNISV